MAAKSREARMTFGNMDRRDFIRKSFMVCCMANIPAAGYGLSKKSKQEKATTEVKPVELAAHCGIYCGACDIHQKRISQAGNELKKVLDALEFESFANQVPGLENYDTFYKTLNTLITFFGQCAGCQKGGGPPQCQIRTCCKEKGYQTCAQCDSYPCDKVKYIVDGYPPSKNNIEEIRNIGLEKWSAKQQEMVDKGFRYSDYQKKKEKGTGK
jgi:hypothetical protein